MSIRTLVVLALAIVCGGSSAAGVYLLRSRTSEKPEMVTVVVATQELARGEVVTEQKVTTRDWPSGYVPPNAIRDPALVVNRTTMAPILSGEPILNGKLADTKSGRGLAALIPEGRRAYTIQTSRVASNVAGFVEPGNRVDVLLTLRGGPDDNTGGGSSTTLLQAVEILAVDQRLDATDNRTDPQQLRSVTLLVTPDQASLLDLGQNMGTLALSLRNPGDVAESDTLPATVNVLRFTQREPVPDASDVLKTGSGFLAAAAATALKAAVMTNLPGSTGKSKPKPRYLQTQTLRGRHTGRILIRSEL